MKAIWYLTQLVLVLSGAQLFIAPIVIRFFTKQSANPQFEPFDLSSPPIQLPSSYLENIGLLESLGFETVAHVWSGTLSTTVRTVLTIFVNRREKVVAVVVHMLAELPPVTRLLNTYTEFCTQYDDGSELNTINSDQVGLFVEVPEKEIFRMPHLKDPRQLYQIHRALAIPRVASNKRLARPGEEVVELIDGMKRDYAREAAFGRIALDDTGNWYRPTMRGAIYCTLKTIWPAGMLRRALARRRGVSLADEILKNRPSTSVSWT